MSSIFSEDPRIDPRIRSMFGEMEVLRLGNVVSREALLAEETTEAAIASMAAAKVILDSMDTEDIALSAGLMTKVECINSKPDGVIASMFR